MRGGDGYPMVEWFEKVFGIHGKTLDGGHSVANMIIEVAYALGCRSIIMVGFDLAYTKQARYTSLLSESMAAGEETKFTGRSRGVLIEGTTYSGQKVTSEAKWKTEAMWIEQFHQRHPRLHLVNTARDGLAIEGVPYMPLQEALSKFCTQDMDIGSRLHRALQQAASTATSPEKFAKAVHQLSESLDETIEIVQLMQRLLVRVTITHEDCPELLEAGTRLKEQLAFQVCLEPLFKLHTKLFFLRKAIDCRPLLNESQAMEFDKTALENRLGLLVECAKYYRSFLYTMVAWGSLQGQVLPNAGRLTHLEGTEVNL
jgi:hypothetical protein